MTYLTSQPAPSPAFIRDRIGGYLVRHGALPLVYVAHPVGPRPGEVLWYCDDDDCDWTCTTMPDVAPPTTCPQCTPSHGGCGPRQPRFLSPVDIARGIVACNLARAKRWMAWLTAADDGCAFVAPWITAVEILRDDVAEDRARGMRDNMVSLRRCDALVLVGGRISPGMALERAEAEVYGLTVIDATDMGEEPPADGGGCLREEVG